jgi:NADH-quinone oxidoreductase subunit C
MTRADILTSLEAAFGSSSIRSTQFRGELTVFVDRERLAEVLGFARRDLGFDYLVDITTIDHAGTDPRFEIAYELYSYAHGLHLRVKSAAPEDDPEFPTATSLWPGANWHEREAYDMMGVRFAGHPGLKRILMWEGYPFFPLRKEFPLAGKPSEMPDVAFSNTAPLEGGPFVTSPGPGDPVTREPRSRSAPAAG